MVSRINCFGNEINFNSEIKDINLNSFFKIQMMKANNHITNYHKNTVSLFKYYKSLGDKSFNQLNTTQLKWRPDSESNNITTIVKHMVGNMLSRWTDFLNSDGEKEWRNRDDEFEDTLQTKEEMLAYWEKGWTCLFSAIEPLNEDDYENKLAYIRNEGHTITEAMNRQLGHYAYHTGQIVFLAKMCQREKWNTLSIAKGKSKDYNKNKFDKDKSVKHFLKDGDPSS